MVYAYTQDVPIREELYRRIVKEIGPDPFPGGLLHLCVRRDDGSLYYIDVWESEKLVAAHSESAYTPQLTARFGGQRPGAQPVTQKLDVIDASGALLTTHAI
jgi:hypothetical protein